MKAVVARQYGTPDSLQVLDVDKPDVADDQVRVKVHAASLNGSDREMLQGWFLIRLSGLRRPNHEILGTDIAGTVEAVGRDVRQFEVGDEVLGELSGHGMGALAEYAVAPERALIRKPPGLTFEQAAAVPQAGLLALQGVRDRGEVQPDQQVLINGAGGGVGTFAVQLAKHYGAEVTAVDSEMKFEMLRAIGADHVLDYRQEDFTRTGLRYDLILDVMSTRSAGDYLRALKSGGSYAMVGGSAPAVFRVVVLGALATRNRSESIGLMLGTLTAPEDLTTLVELIEAGTISPVIDRTYPLDEAAEAFRRLYDGSFLGKIVITM